MDLIRSIQALLGPLLLHTSFVLDQLTPLDTRTGRTYGVLEYHGTGGDGRLVLLGFYQQATRRTVAAQMWTPQDARHPAMSMGSPLTHRQVWSYEPGTERDDLARAIVAEVATWLQSSSRTCGPECDASCWGA